MPFPACRCGCQPGSARGFTLVELLVAVSIIGVLVALLIPAVQVAREASRRAGCGNNLHQIGLALSNYQAALNVFPPGGIEFRLGSDLTKRQLAWSAFILPQLEQPALHRQIDWQKAFDAPENAAAAATVVPVYVCPSNRKGRQLVEGRGPITYGGMYGERITGPNNPPKGLMVYDLAFRDAHVRDGLSNTIIVAEDTGFSDGQWINGRNLFDQAYAINAAPAFENDMRSDHANGAYALLADGAARFLSASTDKFVLAALCTRAGGEGLAPPW